MLRHAAPGERQNQADRMADRFRLGLRKLIAQHGGPACVYAESSSFQVYFGVRPGLTGIAPAEG